MLRSFSRFQSTPRTCFFAPGHFTTHTGLHAIIHRLIGQLLIHPNASLAHIHGEEYPCSTQGPPCNPNTFSSTSSGQDMLQVAFIGSGAWATAAARVVARNVAKQPHTRQFNPQVRMWVHPEQVAGRWLHEVINEQRENVKYLPGVALPENIVATTDIQEAAQNGKILVFCLPHQFLHSACGQLKGASISPNCTALSLVKGMHVSPEGPQFISSTIKDTLGLDCSVLMGANIAEDVGRDQLAEATVGCQDESCGHLIRQLFHSPQFQVSVVKDVAGVEMAGTLKNIVALGAGFVDGLGAGANSKAVIIRRGLHEMITLSKAVSPGVELSTFLESCGVADLVASCYGGRNRRVAEAYVKASTSSQAKDFDTLEDELLGGQKLQGVLTSNEVQELIAMRRWEQDYPLFTVINAIVQGKLPPSDILQFDLAAQKL